MNSFALRVPDDVLEQARVAAEEDQTSVDQLLTSLIAHGLGQRHGLKMMRDRASRADVAAVIAMLDGSPDAPPEAGDELPARTLPAPISP